MDVVHRVLGIAAAVGNRVGRMSINFIKLNWLLMFGLGAGLVGAGNELRYALVNGSALPRTEVREVEAGYQYYGLARRRAVRIHHRANGKPVTTVISCTTPAQRRAIADLLRANAASAQA